MVLSVVRKMEVGNIRRQIEFVNGEVPLGFSSMSIHFSVFSPTESLHKNHCPLGIWNISPIYLMDASVSPLQVGGCGMISLKYAGLLANEVMEF